MKKLIIITVCVIALSSCAVQPYQKMYLNDADMELSGSAVEGFEDAFQSYREGASGGNGAKAGGGADAIKIFGDRTFAIGSNGKCTNRKEVKS